MSSLTGWARHTTQSTRPCSTPAVSCGPRWSTPATCRSSRSHEQRLAGTGTMSADRPDRWGDLLFAPLAARRWPTASDWRDYRARWESVPAHRYLLGNARAEAGERFVWMAALFDGVTCEHFARLGVGAGSPCWGVGAGGPG